MPDDVTARLDGIEKPSGEEIAFARLESERDRLVGLVQELRVQLAVVTAQQRRVIALMDVVARLQLADAATGDRDVSFLALADAVYGDDQ